MEPHVEARFERIESILHVMAERENRMDIRFDKQHAQAMQRMDRMEERQNKADTQILATRKLVHVGMRLMVELQQGLKEIRQGFKELQIQQKKTKASLDELAKSHKAFLDSLRNAGNGHKR